MLSNLGGLIQMVGAGWMMASLTRSEAMIALVQASNTLPIMVLSLFGGVLADSRDRRRVMIAAQSYMGAASVLLALMAWAGWVTPWLLLTLTFMVGAGTALNNPSWQASVVDLVGRADLPQAVSLNSMGFNLMRTVGPALGGLIVAVAGAGTAFFINGVSFVPLVAALIGWRPPPRVAPEASRPVRALLREGIGHVARAADLRRVVVRGGMFGFSAAAVMALMPVVARDRLGGDALTYGLMLGAFGFGAIGGALANPWIRARLTSEGVIRLAFLVFALGSLGVGFSGRLAVSMGFLTVSGGAWVLALSLMNVTMQMAAPRWVVGRALAIYQMATFGGIAAGSSVWGLVAEAAGLRVAFAGAALCLMGGAAAGRWFGLEGPGGRLPPGPPEDI